MKKFLSAIFLLTVAFSPTFVLGQAMLSIADETTIVGESFLFPVELINEGDTVSSVYFEMSYDSLSLEFQGISETNTISDSVLSIAYEKEGIIRFSLASTYSIYSSGTLVYLEFNSIKSGDTQLAINNYRINEREVVLGADEARIRVFGAGGNQPPFAVNIPDTLVLFSGDTLRFSIDESVFADAEDSFDSLNIQVSINPQVVFGSFDEGTGLLTITTAEYVGFAVLNIRVEDTDGGVFEESIVLDIQLGVSNELQDSDSPINFELHQNYPNPFNPSTNIGFTLEQSGFTQLEVFNLHGQKVATIIKNRLQAGSHVVTFDASAFASGIYLYRLSSGDQVITKRMLLIK